jgi:peptidoglycan hydrolase CwlO-like protein
MSSSLFTHSHTSNTNQQIKQVGQLDGLLAEREEEAKDLRTQLGEQEGRLAGLRARLEEREGELRAVRERAEAAEAAAGGLR